jgi:hypothetical protein
MTEPLRDCVVITQGVYIQDVQGPFTLVGANEVAKAKATVDHDDWHSYDVYRLDPKGLQYPPLFTYRKDT